MAKAKAKSLSELFNANAKVDDAGNTINVGSDFYYSQIGVDKKTADKVNQANLDFQAKAAEATRDKHLEIMGNGETEAVSTVFETGTSGLTFAQHTMMNDTESGISTVAEMKATHVEGGELDTIFQSYHDAFADGVDSEEDAGAEEE